MSEGHGRAGGPSDAEHQWLGYENPSPGRFVAICSCGWRSEPYTSAGLAGGAYDHHLADLADAADPAADGDDA